MGSIMKVRCSPRRIASTLLTVCGLNVGMLLVDEIKIQANLVLSNNENTNSRVVGFVGDMEIDLEPTQVTEEPKLAQYVTQFGYRDMLTTFECIGPYFFSSSTMITSALVNASLQSVVMFETLDLNVFGLCMDAGGTNRAMVTELTKVKAPMKQHSPAPKNRQAFILKGRVFEAFPADSGACCNHPYRQGAKLWFMFDPSHLMKSMRNWWFNASSSDEALTRGQYSLHWGLLRTVVKTVNEAYSFKDLKITDKHLNLNSW